MTNRTLVNEIFTGQEIHLLEVLSMLHGEIAYFVSKLEVGSPRRIRTADPVINSHLLYR